jgi:DNA-nicking Smr family endonuclease
MEIAGGRKIRTYGGNDSAAARRIPEPQHIPWLETGAKANSQYLKFRAEAIKHGSVRNKFLQRYVVQRREGLKLIMISAAQAWNRNDARAAKALSLRGQAENEAMRKAHREAAKALYEERNRHLQHGDSSDEELYVDLHGMPGPDMPGSHTCWLWTGLHPEEAVEYLEEILLQHEKGSRRVIYAITGTGHHSKNGKDKVGKGVRGWLNEGGWSFREFSVPGERGGYVGGVLGIDVSGGRRSNTGERDDGDTERKGIGTVPSVIIGEGMVRVLKRDEVQVWWTCARYTEWYRDSSREISSTCAMRYMWDVCYAIGPE